MCQSQANGGQRCAGHARKRMVNAQEAYAANPSVVNLHRMLESADVYASTPAGQQATREAAQLAEENGDKVTAETLQRTLEKGELIRERNKAIEQASGVQSKPEHTAALDSDKYAGEVLAAFQSTLRDGSENKTQNVNMVRVLGKPNLDEVGLEEAKNQYESITEQLKNFPEKDANKIRAAMNVAWQLHSGQFRKSTTTPYITHPLSNLQRLMDYGVTDSDMLAAAAMHDCVEDCSKEYAEKVGGDFKNPAKARETTQRGINRAFGKGTGYIVAAVSNELQSDKSLSTEEKNKQYVTHARTQISAHFGAFMVKYSDFLDNAGGLRNAKFEDPNRQRKLATKYLPLAGVFREVADEHLRAGNMNLSAKGQAELRRELDRIESDLKFILS